MEYEELAPGDEGFDFAEKLAEELAEVAEIAPMDEGADGSATQLRPEWRP